MLKDRQEEESWLSMDSFPFGPLLSLRLVVDLSSSITFHLGNEFFLFRPE